MTKFYEYIPTYPQLPQHAIIKFAKIKDLYDLQKTGITSRDKGGSNVGKNKILSNINKTKDDVFVSAAVCYDQDSLNKVSVYGSVLLILDKNKIANDGYIFNGDFQDLSLKVNEYENELDILAFCNLSDNSFDQFIDERVPSVEKYEPESYKCLISHYFECRIFRPLKIQDVEEIYVPPLPKGTAGSLNKYLKKVSGFAFSVDDFDKK